MSNKIRAIITGATGMVGEGVLHECLNSNEVEAVLIVNRKPSGFTHPKLKEILLPNFFDQTAIADQLKGYNTCFFCLGVSSVGMKEAEYEKMTYHLTMSFAQTLLKQNPDMTFCYISGASTDSTEKGSAMWARVKGKTENNLLKMGFKHAYMFRPGYMQPTPGLKNTQKLYKAISWMYPALRLLARNHVSTLAELGQAMINAATKGYDKPVLEVRDILVLAK